MISRRNLLLGAAAGLAGGTGISYAHYYEPTQFEVTYHRLRFFPQQSADPPLKVLFLTDLHYSRYVSLALISTDGWSSISADRDRLNIQEKNPFPASRIA
ncbi:hypothetical protein [Superficieibacter sp. HKU1]|uniref:hypothetical protein n=1 Tax=Superficieibacter sp. HKU1 TaxID=3031919 RepID=UPI0023E19447|nr:hypothetical protein [Superficieibacter sp. HKU1]WES69374.1 hypothetical protein P0H77_05030 [Superficieibacter sp. HKU1]